VITAEGMGFAGGAGPGSPGSANNNHNGGAHGGQGGVFTVGYSNQTYGSVIGPVSLGSGGAQGAGSGAIRLTVTGAVQHDGTITADGPYKQYARGAAGSVYLVAGSLAGSGIVRANGHDTGDNASGGGGRVSLVVTDPGATFDAFILNNVSARGGNATTVGYRAGAGTVYLCTAAQGAGRGTVTINNGNQVSDARTQIPPAISPVLDELRYASVLVTNRGALAITVSDRIQSLTVATANEPLNLGTNGTVLTLGQAMTINTITYTKGGLYTTNNWNGFTKPTNVTGAGALLLHTPAGTVIMVR